MRRMMLSFALFAAIGANAQVFEEPKDNGESFEKATTKVGGDFALQFQALSHKDDANNLIPLGKNFNLPTANLNLDADLAKGIKLNLVTYLSARHHNEAWVKGGYLLMDQLPFLKSELADNVMKFLTLKVGVMEINYGDAHFRRSDNGNVIRNPFVGNYIMDAFTTAPALEAMYRNNGFIAMAAVSSGSLRPDLTLSSKVNDTTYKYNSYNATDELAYYGKVGYDGKLNDDIRVRLTVSGYYCAKHHFGSLYNGDRTGSRYYLIMNLANVKTGAGTDIKANHLSGNWGPGLTNKDVSMMLNGMVSLYGAEFFGTYENASTTNLGGADLKFNQIAVEGLYRFGGEKQFFGGVRYNTVSGNTKSKTTETDQSVSRIQAGAGWFLLKSTVVKLEYVNQKYTDFAEFGGKGSFNGVMFEAAISF